MPAIDSTRDQSRPQLIDRSEIQNTYLRSARTRRFGCTPAEGRHGTPR
jgi:hypothetical protein